MLGVYPLLIITIFMHLICYGLFVFEFDNINAGWLNINVLIENNSSEDI